MDFDTAAGYSVLACIGTLFLIAAISTVVAVVRSCREEEAEYAVLQAV